MFLKRLSRGGAVLGRDVLAIAAMAALSTAMSSVKPKASSMSGMASAGSTK
jgi:hypothetical protein